MKKCKYHRKINCVNNFRKQEYGWDEHGQVIIEKCPTCPMRKAKITKIQEDE